MNNPDYTVNHVTWAKAQRELMSIRTEVFVQEQQVPENDEWDGEDEDATHFLVCAVEHQVIATARVLTEQDATGKELYHIGRVAVRKPWRGQGVGRELMRVAIKWCLHQNADAELYLHAQLTRKNFYEHLGFVPQGAEFMDAGIPHIAMWYHGTRENS